jgi:hypothetical protein
MRSKASAVAAVAVVAMVILGGANTAHAGDNGDGTYTVEQGDTLSEVFPSAWDFVCIANAANGTIPDCDSLQVGDRLDSELSLTEMGHLIVWFQNVPEPPPPPPAPEPEPEVQYTEPEASVPQAAPEPEPQSGGASNGWAIPEDIVMCESGGDYTAHNPHSSASGAYQITDGTWDGYGGYNSAAEAPPSVQDERAAQIWNGGAGRGNWVC